MAKETYKIKDQKRNIKKGKNNERKLDKKRDQKIKNRKKNGKKDRTYSCPNKKIKTKYLIS
jgi:hypothetical protein